LQALDSDLDWARNVRRGHRGHDEGGEWKGRREGKKKCGVKRRRKGSMGVVGVYGDVVVVVVVTMTMMMMMMMMMMMLMVVVVMKMMMRGRRRRRRRRSVLLHRASERHVQLLTPNVI
jgi:hypothetical protein